MHFLYLDEAGDTGTDLGEQPIFVLGVFSVSDEKWNSLENAYKEKISNFLGRYYTNNFELHSEKMRNRQDIWSNYTFEQLNKLTLDLIDLIVSNGHKIHFFTIDKKKMSTTPYVDYPYDFNPYFLAYEYILNYINSYISNVLGKSARGIFIIDEKGNVHGQNLYYDTIRKITDKCRYEVPKNNRLKRIVEFTYPIDSRKNSMIQLSDLIIYCIKKHFEYKFNLIPANKVAKNFYDQCFKKIKQGIWRKKFIECTMCGASDKKKLNTYLKSIGIFK